MPHSSLAVSDSRGKIFSGCGPGTSARNSWMAPMPMRGNTETNKTTMPMPPNHCSRLRHKSTARGWASRPVMTVAPVAVTPAKASNNASAQWGVAPDNAKGSADTAAAAAQPSVTTPTAVRMCNSSAGVRKRRAAPAATARAEDATKAHQAASSPASSAYSAGISMASPTMASKLPTWRAKRRGCIVTLFLLPEQFLHLRQRGRHAEQHQPVPGADLRLAPGHHDFVVTHHRADHGAVQAAQIRQGFPRGRSALLHHQLHRLGPAVLQQRHGHDGMLAHQFQHRAGGDKTRHHHRVRARPLGQGNV